MCSRARVSIDGQFIAQIDTSTVIQEGYQAVPFSAMGLTPGAHTLTIDVVGRNGEPAGNGRASRDRRLRCLLTGRRET